MTKLLGLGAGKGGDTSFGQQLPRDTVDGGRRYEEAGRQLQIPIVLHHAYKTRLRSPTPNDRACQIRTSQAHSFALYFEALNVHVSTL